MIAGDEQGRLPLRRESIPTGELFRRSLQRFAAEAAARGRSLSAAVGVPSLLGDPVRLEQAVCSLLDNAVRHGAGDVEATARSREHTVEVHVTDEGPGFPAEYLPHAFERFSRPATVRTGGSGLGLSLVAAIAHAHGGSAHAANRPGHGADVWLVLPAEPASPAGGPLLPAGGPLLPAGGPLLPADHGVCAPILPEYRAQTP